MSRYSPIMRSNQTASGSINSFTIFRHPLSHFLQALNGHFRKFTIRLRTDVHQQICIFTGSFHQIVNQSFSRFIILICNLVSPHTIHRLTCFKRQMADALSRKSCSILSRQITLEDLNIFSGKRCLMVVVTYQASRLQTMNKCILLGKFPIEIGIDVLIPPTVKPDSADRTIISQQLCQLIIHKLIIALPISFRIGTSGSTSGSSLRSIFTIPVYM